MLAIAIPLAIAVIFFFAINLYRKSKVYRITNTNIESERGIVTKKIDGSTRTIVLNLDLGLLTVMPDPALRLPGAEVFLDGDRIGTLPLVRTKVPAGKHELVVRWPGAEQPFRKSVEIPP